MITARLGRVLHIQVFDMSAFNQAVDQKQRTQAINVLAAELSLKQIAARRTRDQTRSFIVLREKVHRLAHAVAFHVMVSGLNFNFPEHRVLSWLEPGGASTSSNPALPPRIASGSGSCRIRRVHEG